MARRSIVEAEQRLELKIAAAEQALASTIAEQNARIAAMKECLAELQAPAESEDADRG